MATLTKNANAHTAITTGYTNPQNAFDGNNDTTYATASVGQNSVVSAYFGFPAFSTSDIPDGSTINSVKVEQEYKVNSNMGIATQAIQAFVDTTAVG